MMWVEQSPCHLFLLCLPWSFVFIAMNITNCSTLLVYQEEECQGLFYSLIAFFSFEM